MNAFAITKYKDFTDEELQILLYAVEDLRRNMRKNWNQLNDFHIGWDIDYIYTERGRQARALNDLLLELEKERYVRDSARHRLQLGA